MKGEWSKINQSKVTLELLILSQIFKERFKLVSEILENLCVARFRIKIYYTSNIFTINYVGGQFPSSFVENVAIYKLYIQYIWVAVSRRNCIWVNWVFLHLWPLLFQANCEWQLYLQYSNFSSTFTIIKNSLGF